MYKIKTLNNISEIGMQVLTGNYQIASDIENPEGILVRSASMHDMELPSSLTAIARAGAGVNNIPIEKCSENGIVVFNTPGANANAVKELVIAGLLMSSRKIVEGITWANGLKSESGIDKLVEKGKAEFTGPEIMGKKLGVIGLGAIGVMVANAAKSLGMEVTGFDPFISIDAAWGLSRSVNKAVSLEALLAESDYITVHIPLNDKTKNMFNSEMIKNIKKGARLLNFSRAELADPVALREALEDETLSCYVTDFPTDDTINLPNTLLIPHLGASTPESEDNCAEMAARQLKDYLEYGNIVNSVNFPETVVQYVGKVRIAILHKNMPNVVSGLASTVGKQNINIDKMVNNSRGAWAYTIMDIDDVTQDGNFDAVYQEIITELRKIEAVVNVRIIKK